MKSKLVTLFALGVTGLSPALHLQAQEEGWTNDSELSYLLSGGNAETSSFGLRNTLRWIGGASEVRIRVAALRSDATEIERLAVGTGASDFVLRENRNSERTAERYSAETRYDRDLSDRFFAFGSVDWKRDTFAGFRNRTVGSLGAGNQWGPGEEDWALKIGYGVTYTNQEDVEPDPTKPDSFAGARLTLDYAIQLSGSTGLEFQWVVDANAEDAEDLRGDFVQSVSSSLSSRLSLKTTLQLLWDNDPPLGRVPLVDAAGDPLGGEVLLPLEEVDHNVAVAIVITL